MNNEKYSKFTLEKILDVCEDIFYELELSPVLEKIPEKIISIPFLPSIIKYPSLLPADTPKLRDEYCRYRFTTLEYLKNKGVIKNFLLTDEFHRWDKRVEVELVEDHFIAFYKNIKEQYEITKQKKEAKSHSSLFPTPPGTKWEDVKIKMIDSHTLVITVKNIRKRMNFVELGFKDNRNALPDKNWENLIKIAENYGKLSWESGKAIPFVQKSISTIRKRLKNIFGINDDPFYLYKEEKAYKTKFQIEFTGYDSENSLKEDIP